MIERPAVWPVLASLGIGLPILLAAYSLRAVTPGAVWAATPLGVRPGRFSGQIGLFGHS